MSTLKLSIFSPERRWAEGVLVSDITLNGSEGQIQILPGHAAMVGTLEAGPFHYISAESKKVVGKITQGFFEVRDGEVTVLAGSVEMESTSAGVAAAH
jgi:F-type H+-transporting ATPase subunit epsilon